MRPTGALLALTLACFSVVRAGDDGITGNWKLSIVDDGQFHTLWLLKLEQKGGKVTGSVEGLRHVPASTVTELRIEGDRLYLTLGLKDKKGAIGEFEGILPKAGGKKILGSMPWGREAIVTPVVLEFTTAKNAFEVEKEIVTRFPNDQRVFPSVQELISKAPGMKVPAKDVQDWLEVALKLAEKHGPRFLQDTALGYSEMLLRHDAYAKVAIEALKRAEKALPAKATADDKIRLLETMVTALKKAGDLDAIKGVQSRIALLEAPAHEEYNKLIINFKTPKFGGRKGKSNRAVLVELFTGAQCPPCVAADVGFDALGKSFQPSEVVLLQYHLHIPLPDALTNADSEARQDYYKRALKGTPTIFFDGKPGPAGGGGLPGAEEKYRDYREELEGLLEKPAGVNLKVSATRMGDKIHIKANAEALQNPGDKIKLRVALVEDWARYRGRNGLLYHHHIVRAMPGGPQGTALTKKDSAHTFDVDLEQLRRGLTKYLDDFNKSEDGPFPDDQRPMALRNLRVVVFVQNDENREVLQAAETEVREQK